MTKIVIIGSGGLASDITTCFEGTSSKHYQDLQIKGYIDYDYNIDKYWKRYNFDNPVLDDIDNYSLQDDEYFVLGIADVKFRNMMINKIKEKGGKFINLIHPRAIVDKNSVLGTGNIIFPDCFVGANVKIGNFNICTLQSIIGHDCRVGNNNIIATSVISGHVKVGDDNFFSLRSTVLPRITLGSRNIIQAGMIVDKDVADGSVVFHRFREKVTVIARETSA